jgi:hypothetical protein
VLVSDAIKPAASNAPKKTVTIEIGKEALNTPIVYRSPNNKYQVLLRVPMSGNLAIPKVCPVQISWITCFKSWAPTEV